MADGTGYDDSGHTLTCDFPYSEVDHRLYSGPIDDTYRRDFQHEVFEKFCELHMRISEWRRADDPDEDGYHCRCILSDWVMTPWLRSGYNMTKIAARHGKKKQSISRFVKSFKRRFPELRPLFKYIDET